MFCDVLGICSFLDAVAGSRRKMVCWGGVVRPRPGPLLPPLEGGGRRPRNGPPVVLPPVRKSPVTRNSMLSGAGVVAIYLCHALVRAVVGVIEHGGMFHAQLEKSFYLVPGSGGVCRVVCA